MTHGWPDHWFDWSDPGPVRERLAAGADPNVRLHAVQNTPLHNAVWTQLPNVAVVGLLLEYGADINARNGAGLTPLWYAVRNGSRDCVARLLDAGADPWAAEAAGRSAGRVALDGPLADLFAGRPGAPVVSAEERQHQADADALIASYGSGWEVCYESSVAFVGGLDDEDEVIRRIGARPAECPTVRHGDLRQAARGTGLAGGTATLWVGAPPGGGVVVYEHIGITPVDTQFGRRVSAGGAVMASMFDNPAGGDQRVDWWRDGACVARPSPFGDPGDHDPSEAWLCRFGDHAHESSMLARNLALMTMLTGVRPSARWLVEAPKRLVRIADAGLSPM